MRNSLAWTSMKASGPGASRATSPSPPQRRTKSMARTPRPLVANGVQVVSEGANMPTTPDGVSCFHDARVLYGPGKAANAGGVAVSGLEQSQNALRLQWTSEEVDERLRSSHVPDSLPVRRVRRRGQLRGLREGRQRRGLPQGRRRDAGARLRLTELRSRQRVASWKNASTKIRNSGESPASKVVTSSAIN